MIGDFDWPPSDEDQADAADILRDALVLIEEHDQEYEPRYALVLMAVAMATSAGLKAGFAIDPAEPDWPVAYIELPTGQVSWHMPAHPVVFDGHDKAEKYARCKAYVEAGIETPEQSAAIVDANLARMGVTLGGNRAEGTDSTSDT